MPKRVRSAPAVGAPAVGAPVYNISDLCGNAFCFATAKPLIDAEIAKCRLLCSNCHRTRRKWDTAEHPPSSEAGPSSA